MILQSLCDYYSRKAAEPDSTTAPQGWEWKELPFLVVIDEQGNFCHLEDTRTQEGKKLVSRRFLVPQAEKRANGIKANLLWDNAEYVLGANPRGREDIQKRHKAFKERIYKELQDLVGTIPVRSVLAFLEKNPLRQIEKNPQSQEAWEELCKTNSFIAFRIAGSPDQTIFETLKTALDSRKPQNNTTSSICLITGEKEKIARIHPSIKGVRGAQPAGASLSSFNLAAFKSYGKDQNLNAPVSEKAVFRYTTALNILLDKNSKNKLSFGDDSVVFWAHKPPEKGFDMEQLWPDIVVDPPKDNPDKGVEAIQALYAAAKTGNIPEKSDDKFYILSLSPNAARIAVRFWRSGTVKDFSSRILQHFDDVAVCHGPKEPEHVTLHQMLRATAFEFKASNVLPKLGGAFMTAILDGTPYPVTLFQQCMRRIRAERHINRIRAGIIKGYLNRRPGRLKEEVISVALDEKNKNVGYRLGRLFAALEKIQEDSYKKGFKKDTGKTQGNLNATIRDRFYGAASSTPVTVFSQLLKLKNHHLKKIDAIGIVVNHEKRLGEILSEVSQFPAHLTMEEQGFFAIGYYHQRQNFFTKKETDEENIAEEL